MCAVCTLFSAPLHAEAQAVRVWVVGDSTVPSLSQGLDYVLKERDAPTASDAAGASFKVRALFRTSSGLARPDFFDWPAAVTSALAQGVPDVAILCIGANDTQPLLPPGRPSNVVLHTPEWRTEYMRRLTLFARLFVAKSVKVYLMLPSFDPSFKYANTMEEISACMRATAEAVGVGVLDAPALVADKDGHFRKTMVNARGQVVPLRSADGVHLSGYGGVILARGVLRTLNEAQEGKPERLKTLDSVQMTLK
jgi:uncharacterized protein